MSEEKVKVAGSGVSRALSAVSSVVGATKTMEMFGEAIKSSGPVVSGTIIRCRECLKTSPLRRVQHFYLCEKHYKEWRKL